jgi:hypothetical protein
MLSMNQEKKLIIAEHKNIERYLTKGEDEFLGKI